eukprot:Nitzschia sp. Nitz4//scaffold26_size159584//113686//114435//NITZ4_002506-RA/size159584-processed-gene-0.202-mRNA-1//1//CDS//3329545127//3237//frame0
MEAFHRALTEIMDLSSQASQAMASRQYGPATDGFSQALRKAKYELTQCSTRTLPAAAVMTTMRVDLGIAQGAEEEYAPLLHNGADALMFRQPILLRLSDSDEGQRNTDDQLLQTLCFGIMLNLALCHHIQALLDHQRVGEEASHSFRLQLNRAMQLYQLAGEMHPAVQERHSPLQLILLNNMGEAFLQAASLRQAIRCFQTLSATVEWFRSGDPLDTTQRTADMEFLVQRFYSQRNARFPIATTCAPLA